MAKTAIADIIIPTAFEKYAIERTAELSSFGQCGIIEGSPVFDELAAGGGRTVEMPFWKDLSATRQLLSDSASLTVNKITADKDAELGGSDAVRKAISALPPEQITADLKAVADYITQLPACNGKLAVAGFCWGGSQTFRFATNDKRLKAAFVFYGTAPETEEDLARIPCPVYGFYAGNDARVTATVPQTAKLMKEVEKVYEPKTYEGAGHGFMRAGEAPDASTANKRARDAAWRRWLALLKKL